MESNTYLGVHEKIQQGYTITQREYDLLFGWYQSLYEIFDDDVQKLSAKLDMQKMQQYKKDGRVTK